MNHSFGILSAVLLYVPLAYCAGPRFIFTFGDSYSGTNFNIDGTKPTQSNPLGNPGYGRNTSCANSPDYYCPNWVEVLTVNLSATNTLSFNFAVGGSVINNRDSKVNALYNLTTQVVSWTAKVAPKPSYASWNAANSVFIFWFGVNDLLSIGGGSKTSQTDINNDLNDLFTNIKWMYNYGGRKFVIFNAPPFNKAPAFSLGNPSGPTIAGNITTWNNVLPTMTNDFVKNWPGSTVKILDTFTIFNKILNDPNKYPNPWADLLHPGADIQKSVAAGAYSVLQGLSFYSS